MAKPVKTIPFRSTKNTQKKNQVPAGNPQHPDSVAADPSFSLLPVQPLAYRSRGAALLHKLDNSPHLVVADTLQTVQYSLDEL